MKLNSASAAAQAILFLRNQTPDSDKEIHTSPEAGSLHYQDSSNLLSAADNSLRDRKNEHLDNTEQMDHPLDFFNQCKDEPNTSQHCDQTSVTCPPNHQTNSNILIHESNPPFLSPLSHQSIALSNIQPPSLQPVPPSSLGQSSHWAPSTQAYQNSTQDHSALRSTLQPIQISSEAHVSTPKPNLGSIRDHLSTQPSSLQAITSTPTQSGSLTHAFQPIHSSPHIKETMRPSCSPPNYSSQYPIQSNQILAQTQPALPSQSQSNSYQIYQSHQDIPQSDESWYSSSYNILYNTPQGHLQENKQDHCQNCCYSIQGLRSEIEVLSIEISTLRKQVQVG